MSEAENQATSILLPTSGVAVYSKDAHTLESARKLANDWRFARVNLQVEEGDVLAAAQVYSGTRSPDLVIVQTDSIEEGFADQLAALASNCSENTAAIVIGPVNDVYLYRKLIDMGVSDYLVRPVETDVLAEVIAKALIERLGVTGSHLIAFIGAKGGVGTSVLAQASAWCAAEILGQKTVLIDASGGWSVMSVGMGFEPSTTLPEAAKATDNRDEDSLKRMLFKAGEHLSVLASGGDALLDNSISARQLESMFDMLMAKYPVVVVDLSHAPADLSKVTLIRSNHIFIVSTPTLSSLRLGRSLLQEIKDLRGGSVESVDMIINKQGMAIGHEVPKKDIEKAMDFKISTIIPFNAKVFMGCESDGRRLVDDKEGKSVVQSYLTPLLQKILSVAANDEEDAHSAGSQGFLSSLLGRKK